MALLRVVPQSDPDSRTAHEHINGRSNLPTPGATPRGSHCSVLQRNAGINGRVTSGRASERRVRRPVPENEARRGSRATIECVVSPAQSEGIRRGWRGKAAGCGKRAHEPFTACCHTRASHLMAIGAGTLPHRLRGAATPRRQSSTAGGHVADALPGLFVGVPAAGAVFTVSVRATLECRTGICRRRRIHKRAVR